MYAEPVSARVSITGMPISSNLDMLGTHVKWCQVCVCAADRDSILAQRQQERAAGSSKRARTILGNISNVVGPVHGAAAQPVPSFLFSTTPPTALPRAYAQGPGPSFPGAFSVVPPSGMFVHAPTPSAIPLHRTDTVPDLPLGASDIQKEFAADLCRLFVALNLAWNAAAHPETKAFFARWLPHLHVPDRRTLSGPLLRAEKQKVVARIRSKVHGKYAMLQCDGWRNVARISIVTSMMTVGDQVRGHFC